MNQLWILKNSNELVEHLKSPNLNHITIIKFSDFSTFYTTIHHDKLKSRLANIIRNSFIFKKGIPHIQISSIWSRRSIFCEGTLLLQKRYTEDDIKMHEFLVDNIFVVFCVKGFPAESRYSNGNQLCPSVTVSRHISLLI